MALPANVSFGTVTGRFLTATADSPTDTDRDPEGNPATDLKIVFAPNVTPAVVRDASSTPPTIFALAEIPATVGASGDLIGADGQPGIRLVATTGTTIDPSGWTWKVTLSSPTFPALSFSFSLDPGQTIDLATVVQVPASPGATLAAWLQAVADANAAADRAEAAAAGGGGASDADIAALVTDPTTATGTALAGSYALRSTVLGYRAAAVGDSITATTNDVTNNQLTDSWFSYLILASGGRLQYSGNYAQGGTDSATILARLTAIFDNEYRSRPFDVLFINAGTNDALDSNNRPTATAANIRAMVALCRQHGVRPVLGTLVPAGMTTGLGTPTAAPKGTPDTSGGGLPAGTYYFAYTRYNGIGETPLSPASAPITLGSTGQVNLTLPADKGARYNIYRSTSSTGPWGKVQSLGYITSNSWLPQQFWTDGGSVPNGTPPTTDSTGQPGSPAARRKLETVSRWVRRYAAVNGIDCIDFGSLSDGFGAWKSGMTIDGTHPAPHASRIMGQTAWSQLQFRFPAIAPQLVTDSGDPENLIPNGCFTDNDGTGAGGWGGYGGTPPTRVTGPKAGFVGAAYQVTRTDSSPWYDGGPWVSTGFTAGDRLACGFVLQTEGFEASNALFGAGITFQGGTTPNAVGTLSLGTDIGPVAIWFDTVVPAGVTAISPVFNIANAGNVGNAAPAARASLGQMTVFNLTTGQLVTP